MNRGWADWWIVGAAIVLGTVLAFYQGRESQIGDALNLGFSFVPEDEAGLACAMKPTVAFGCALREDRVTPSGVGDAVIPAVSTSQGLFLVRGAFRGEAARRLLMANRRENGRFTLDCDAELLGTAEEVEVRFGPRNPWSREKKVRVLELRDCH